MRKLIWGLRMEVIEAQLRQSQLDHTSESVTEEKKVIKIRIMQCNAREREREREY